MTNCLTLDLIQVGKCPLQFDSGRFANSVSAGSKKFMSSEMRGGGGAGETDSSSNMASTGEDARASRL